MLSVKFVAYPLLDAYHDYQSRLNRIRLSLGGRALAELLRPHLKERAYD